MKPTKYKNRASKTDWKRYRHGIYRIVNFDIVECYTSAKTVPYPWIPVENAKVTNRHGGEYKYFIRVKAKRIDTERFVLVNENKKGPA